MIVSNKLVVMGVVLLRVPVTFSITTKKLKVKSVEGIYDNRHMFCSAVEKTQNVPQEHK